MLNDSDIEALLDRYSEAVRAQFRLQLGVQMFDEIDKHVAETLLARSTSKLQAARINLTSTIKSATARIAAEGSNGRK